jgi:hypothetical protein
MPFSLLFVKNLKLASLFDPISLEAIEKHIANFSVEPEVRL